MREIDTRDYACGFFYVCEGNFITNAAVSNLEEGKCSGRRGGYKLFIGLPSRL